MIVAVEALMDVVMAILVLAVDVDVCMGVFMGMGVDKVPAGMLVAVGVGMLMGMMETNGVPHHQHSGADHNRQAQIKLQPRTLSQQHHTQHYAKKGRQYRKGSCRCFCFHVFDPR